MRRTLRVVSAVLAVSALSAGCTAPAVDKQGATRRAGVVTLTLGAADPGELSLAHFVDAVQTVSDGRLAVEVDRLTYFSETPGGPARLAPDLGAGEVDLAMIPSRDWAATGDPGFAALQAPFLVASTTATSAVSRGPVAAGLLTRMAAYGAVGLGLVPGEPRRLLTREPIVDASDLAEARIRVSDSAQTMALLSSMGADPVEGMSAEEVRLALAEGTLDGVEMAPIYLGQNAYNVSAPYLSSFALIPKFEVLAASPAAWDDLSARDRETLTRAASETVDWEAARLAGAEASELSLLCRNGLVVVSPSTSALDAWHAAAPTPQGAVASAILRDITSEVLATAPTDQASTLPGDCALATSAAQARARHRPPEPGTVSSPAPTDGPVIPPGTYQETVTAEQLAGAGLSGADFAQDITYTWVLRPDGTFTETQDPDFPDQGSQSGRYVVDGNQWTATYDPGADGIALPPEQAEWSFFEGTLTFDRIVVQDPGTKPLYEQPWLKIR